MAEKRLINAYLNRSGFVEGKAACRAIRESEIKVEMIFVGLRTVIESFLRKSKEV